MRVIPLTIKISSSERDRDLPNKLRAELPGILAWAVRGCRKWQREGLGQPAAVHTATTGWQKEMDHLKRFVAEELKWFRARVFDAVTGSIAEAIFTKRTFHDVWNGHQAEGDLMMFRLSSHEID